MIIVSHIICNDSGRNVALSKKYEQKPYQMHGQNVFIELKLVCRLYGMNSLSLSMISFYIELRKFNKSITTNEQMIKTKNKNTIIAINCNDKTIHIKSVHTHSYDICSTQIPDGNDKHAIVSTSVNNG